MSMRETACYSLAWIMWLVLSPVMFFIAIYFTIWYAANRFVSNLDNIDPMPWNQAALLAIALVFLFGLAVFGNFVGV